MSAVKDHSMTAGIRTFRTFSVIMSAALEFLGYSCTAIKHRQTHFEKIGQTIEGPIIVGSRVEGITLCTENDSDVISVSNECICADDIGDIVINNPRHTLLLLTEMDDLHPGYARIKVPFPDDLSNLHNAHVIPKSSFHAGGDVYLCSALYNSSGLDTVVAIPYRCRILIQEWIARPRFHGWPSQETLQQLAKLDWHLVAERSQNADDSYQKWRICFTLGEQHLVKTLNITQLHLLILLRYVIRKSVRAMCTAFSSYIAKTLVFWMAEILAPENFKVENLSSVLMMSLQMLQQAVKNEQLKNYMIPSLNLFKGNVSPLEKIQIMQLLDRFMDDGPSFIFRQSEFEKLQKAMLTVKKDPEFTQHELKRRNKREKEFLDFSFGLQCRQYKSDASKVFEECSPVDSVKGDKWLMERARDYMERQGINFAEGQLTTVLDGLAGEI